MTRIKLPVLFTVTNTVAKLYSTAGNCQLSGRVFRRLTTAVIAGFCGLLLSASVVTADTTSVSSEPMPFLDLLTTDGQPGDFAQNFDNGKWTLVKIWQAACHVCGEQAPMMSEAHMERSEDFNVVGVSIDGRKGLASANRFISRHQPVYPNYVGELAVVAVNFQLLTESAFRGTPSYLLFSPDNKLMAAQPGMISKDALFQFIDSKS